MLLKELRTSKNYSQQKIADLLNVSRSTVAMWETNKSEPDNETLLKLAEIFNVSLDYLMGRTDETYDILYKLAEETVLNKEFNDLSINQKKQFLFDVARSVKIPVLGSIPAGIPMEAIEDIIGEEEIPSEWTLGEKEFFALKIKGDSMEPEYRSGDIVIFNKQDNCENGDDCAVMVNGDDATFKRVEKLEGGGILLKPLNPNYPTLHYTDEDILNLPIRILGIAWELRRTRKK